MLGVMCFLLRPLVLDETLKTGEKDKKEETPTPVTRLLIGRDVTKLRAALICNIILILVKISSNENIMT